MDKLYVIYKDGKPYRTAYSQYAYPRRRDAKKMITEQVKKGYTSAERFEIVEYERR